MPSTTRLITALIATMTLAAVGAGDIHAATSLSTEGNVLIGNPYADPTDSRFGFRFASGDFDADGIDDIAISELGNSERVRILLGKSYPIGGPYPLMRFTSTTVTTPTYGSILATGDFNGDGIDELAIGDRNSGSNAGGGGSVFVMRRSPAEIWSLQTTIRQGISSYNGVDTAADLFGYSLASGDFDDDGFDDLAIGVPGKDVIGPPFISAAGAVHVVYGSTTGLSGVRDRVFTASNDGLDISSDSADEYGYALASGDFDDDGDDDLAIGVPKRQCPGTGGVRAGGVVVLDGSTSLGLSTLNARAFYTGFNGMSGTCTTEARFGQALSAGKLNGVAYDSLAIGAPYTVVNGLDRAGAVHIINGSAMGLISGGNKLYSQADFPGGVPATLGQFANQLAVGRLRSGAQSLVIAASNETVNGMADAGGFWVMFSGNGSAMVSPALAQHWTASNLRIGPPTAGDTFGGSFAIGDFNGDGTFDLVTGAMRRDSGGLPNVGDVQVIYQSEYLFRDGFDGD